MDRRELWQRLQQGEFDLVVIGGGITGAGVAREAAIRGLRVALVERQDFAAGTSSRSTKLVHGGLRYLKQGDFRLVREAVMERQVLMTMAPHLVRPMAFVFPVYRGDPDGLLKLRLGLTLYDWFAGRRGVRRHRIYRAGALLAQEPLLNRVGLVGGAVYYDCVTDDARLTLAVLADAHRRGAVVLNYAEATGFVTDPTGRIAGVQVRDAVTGATAVVRARQVLNATGPWLDQVRRLEDPAARPVLRLTKGVHIAVPHGRLPLRQAVVMRGADGRLMFAVPRDGFTYLGTTDTDYTGDPGSPPVEAADVAYILAAARRAFPTAQLTEADVVSALAGLRPLVATAGARDPSAVSRDFALFLGPRGLVSVGGGKLTTFRAMATAIVSRLFPGSPHRPAASREPLPGGDRIPSAAELAAAAAATGLPLAEVEALAARYGSGFGAVLAHLQPQDLALGTRTARLLAEARHGVAAEAAQHLLDVLARRTPELLFSADNGAAAAPHVAAAMATALGWPAQRLAAELAAYEAAVAAMFPHRQRDAARA